MGKYYIKNLNKLLYIAIFILCLVAICCFVPKNSNFAIASGEELAAPTIIQQPIGYTKTYQQNLDALTVVATHEDSTVELSYQWFCKKINTEIYIAVGQEQSYEINNVSDSGQYYCLIVATDTDSGLMSHIASEEVVVRITKANITVAIDSVSSIYGEEEQQLTFELRQGSLVGSDTIAMLGITLSKEEGVDAKEYVISGTSSSSNYDVKFNNGTYTILPKMVDVVIDNKSAVYGTSGVQELTCSLVDLDSLEYADTFEDLNIVLAKQSGTAVNTYIIDGSHDNENYIVNFVTGEYVISPKDIYVYFDGYNDLVYNGKLQSISCSIMGSLLLGDESDIVISYNKTPKNAGTYIASARLTNTNYRIIGGSEKTFVIAKKPLKIVLNDIVINVGDTPQFSYTYIGFADGEDEADLQTLPQVENTKTAPADYELTPSSAEASNYLISYKSGLLRINKKKIDAVFGETGSVVGSFSPLTTFSVEEESKQTINKFGSVVSASYKVTIDGILYSDTYKLSIANTTLNRFFMRTAIIDEDGVVRSLRSHSYDGKNLVVEANCQGTIVVYNDYLPIGILGAFIVLFIVFITIYVSRDKKYAKNSQRQVQFANKMADYYRNKTL